jgi:hypothetical protein
VGLGVWGAVYGDYGVTGNIIWLFAPHCSKPKSGVFSSKSSV